MNLTEAQKVIETILAEVYKCGYEEGRCKGYKNRCIEEELQNTNKYEDGLNDAWEAAKKIVCTEGYNWTELENVFNTRTLSQIFNTYIASEAISKIKEYEEKQKQTDGEIKVGDEIERIKGNNDRKYIVTKIIESDYINIMFDDGGVGYVNPIHYRKTRRHFPQIVEVLKQMQEGNEND